MVSHCKGSESYPKRKLVTQKKVLLVYTRRKKVLQVYTRRKKVLLVYTRRPKPQNRWADLPRDIAGPILKLLNLADYCRFACVCKSWRSAALDDPTSKQLPWLMLPYDPKEEARIFCNLVDKKKYRFQVDGFSGGKCCGSVIGWMIMSYEDGRCSLLNPFSSAQIQLPLRKTFLLPAKFRVTPQRLRQRPRSSCSLDKAVLSSAPSSDSCLVAGIFNHKKLAICRPQDKRWNVVEDQALHKEYCDLIYFKGQFFALDMKGGITVFDAELSPKARSWDMSSSYQRMGDELKGSLFLVESSGSLLMVERRHPSKLLLRNSPLNDKVSSATFRSSIRCTIYKLDFNRVRWAKVDEVTRWLGQESSREQLFFLGHCNSWSVKGEGFPKLDQFTTFLKNHFKFQQSFTADAALYFSGKSHNLKSQPMWIAPNPW